MSEPTKERSALAFRQAVRVSRQRREHIAPIRHRAPHIGQNGGEARFKLPAFPRIDPFRFEIDERFPGLTVHTLPADVGERQGIITDDTQHGVNDAFNGYPTCGNGGGHRIHQKWHVVVIQRDPHHQTALRIGEAI